MNRRLWIPALVVLAVAAASVSMPANRFLLGGALINAGYSLQDGIDKYDFRHHEDITPEQVWEEFLHQNEMASSIREQFPRTAYHPVMAILACMDARIDTNELTGDTRREYYIVRTAGSALSPKEEEMLELAVNNGVKVILLTRHTDCAADKVDADPARRLQYPALVASLDERDARVREFLARPAIAGRIASGKLLVKQMVIDTSNDRLLAAAPPPSATAPHGETVSH